MFINLFHSSSIYSYSVIDRLKVGENRSGFYAQSSHQPFVLLLTETDQPLSREVPVESSGVQLSIEHPVAGAIIEQAFEAIVRSVGKNIERVIVRIYAKLIGSEISQAVDTFS